MKALLWKEFRENFKWALLLALMLGGAMSYALFGSPGSDYNQWESICSSPFLIVTTFGFALTALGLGLLQTLPELKKDRWAFWIHRPISPHRLFFSKVVCGFFLYLFATLLPLLGATLWVGLSLGPDLPFTPGMIIPGLISVFAALSFYLGGLLTGFIPGKWYGPRVLPLVAAFAVVSTANVAVGNAMSIFLFCVASVLAFLFVSAWFIFLNIGPLKFLPALGKFSLAFVFALSWFVALFLALNPLSTIFQYSGREEFKQYQVDASGRVLLRTQKGFAPPRFFDPDGKEIENISTQGREKYEFRPETNIYLLAQKRDGIRIDSRRSNSFFFKIYNRNQDRLAWFFDRQRQTFISFDKETQKVAGYLGPDGIFTPEWKSSAAFPGKFEGSAPFDEQNDKTWHFSDAIYWAAPFQKQIALLLSRPIGEIFWANTEVQRRESEAQTDKALIATNKGLYVIPSDGSSHIFIPHPAFVREKTYIRFVPYLNDSHFLVFYSFPENSDIYLSELDAKGGLISLRSLPSLEVDKTALRNYSKKTTFLFSLGLPPLLIKSVQPQSEKDGVLAYLYLGCLGAAILSALLPFTLRRRMDLSLSETILWTAFVLTTGIAGLLSFLAIQGFPRRLACPTCTENRFLDHSHCEHCDAPWPKREQDGTEIREPILAES